MRRILDHLVLLSIAIGFSFSCGPQSGSSDPCGEFRPQASAAISTFADQPAPQSINLSFQRPPSTSITIPIEYSVSVSPDFCGRSYSGPLTFSLRNLPSGVSAAFDPIALLISPAPQPQVSSLQLTIAPTVPDGTISLEIFAAESVQIYSQTYQLVLTTK
jgi:hypothetical protein